MSAPIKKRVIAMMDEDDSSSAPSFESPAPSDEEDDDYKQVDGDDNADEDEEDDDIVGTTFRVPALDSKEDASIGNWGSPSGLLATQPPPSSTEKVTQQLPPTKKRKVSMSPQDSLARNLPQRRSPRSAARNTSSSRSSSAATVDAIVIDGNILPTDENTNSTVVSSKKPTSTSTSSVSNSAQNGKSASGSKVLLLEEAPKAKQAGPMAEDKRTTLETALFSEPSSEAKKATPAIPPPPKEKAEKVPKSGHAKKASAPSSSPATTTTTKKAKKESPAKSKDRDNHGKGNAVQAEQAPSKAKKNEKKKKPTTNVSEQELSSDAAKETVLKSKAAKETGSSANGTATTKPPAQPKNDSATASTQASDLTSSATKPKKKKKKRSFQDQLLHLLFMTCKPYTVKMLAQELKTTDSSVNFCLLALVDKCWVLRKEFTSKSGNRSKEFYWGNHESKNKELMDSLNMVPPHEIERAKKELQTLHQQHVSSARELAMVLKEPSNTELIAQLEEKERDVNQLEIRLKETHTRIRANQQGSGKTAPGSVNQSARPAPFGVKRKQPATKPVSTKRLKKQINDMRLQWKTRKEKCMDFIEQLADGMDKKVKDVVKLLELETDEMMGVKIPPKYDDI